MLCALVRGHMRFVHGDLTTDLGASASETDATGASASETDATGASETGASASETDATGASETGATGTGTASAIPDWNEKCKLLEQTENELRAEIKRLKAQCKKLRHSRERRGSLINAVIQLEEEMHELIDKHVSLDEIKDIPGVTDDMTISVEEARVRFRNLFLRLSAYLCQSDPSLDLESILRK